MGVAILTSRVFCVYMVCSKRDEQQAWNVKLKWSWQAPGPCATAKHFRATFNHTCPTLAQVMGKLSFLFMALSAHIWCEHCQEQTSDHRSGCVWYRQPGLMIRGSCCRALQQAVLTHKANPGFRESIFVMTHLDVAFKRTEDGI